jgi:hypothetical protein
MITIPIDPILFSIGHFHLRWYSLIVTAAVILGVWLALKEAGRKGFNTERLTDSVLWIVIAGMVGARLFHVIDHWPDEFAANPIRALYIWEGGLAIWGGVLGGLAATAVLARINHWKLPRLLDAFVPGVVLAQAVEESRASSPEMLLVDRPMVRLALLMSAQTRWFPNLASITPHAGLRDPDEPGYLLRALEPAQERV